MCPYNLLQNLKPDLQPGSLHLLHPRSPRCKSISSSSISLGAGVASISTIEHTHSIRTKVTWKKKDNYDNCNNDNNNDYHETTITNTNNNNSNDNSNNNDNNNCFSLS